VSRLRQLDAARKLDMLTTSVSARLFLRTAPRRVAQPVRALRYLLRRATSRYYVTRRQGAAPIRLVVFTWDDVIRTARARPRPSPPTAPLHSPLLAAFRHRLVSGRAGLIDRGSARCVILSGEKRLTHDSPALRP